MRKVGDIYEDWNSKIDERVWVEVDRAVYLENRAFTQLVTCYTLI